MRHEVFQRLVENIKRDGGLMGNTPFAWLLHDDGTRQPANPPVYEVLSGNHRVKAARAAELETIEITVTDTYLPPERRKAIQLSHNALVGEDDPSLLKALYEGIDSVDLRLYTGLDDKGLGLLLDAPVAPLSEAGLEFQTIALTFLPHEREAVEDAWQAARKAIAGAKGYWLARWGDYDRFMDGIEAAGLAYNVKNVATALMIVLDVFMQHIDDLHGGFLDSDGQPFDPKRQVPSASVFGLTVPAALAAQIRARGTNATEVLAALLEQAQPVTQPAPEPATKKGRTGAKRPESAAQ